MTNYNVLGFKQSEIEKRMKAAEMNIGINSMDIAKSMMYQYQKQNQGTDADGFPIINVTEENAWFADNVLFVFGKGAIYDEDDDKVFERVLSCFHNEIHGSAFLINKVLIEDYRDSSLLQTLEKQLYIANGNYHICCIPLVLNDADITAAPEKKFAKHGIIDKFMQWSTIEAFISSCVARYGLITEPQNEPKQEMHPIEGFNMDMEYDTQAISDSVDASIQNSAMVDMTRMHINYGGRDNTITNQTQLQGRKKKRANLFTQIQLDNTPTSTTVPDHIDGVEISFNVHRMNDVETVKHPEFKEFQTHVDPNSYDTTTHKNKVTSGAFDTTLPMFNFKKSGKKPIYRSGQ